MLGNAFGTDSFELEQHSGFYPYDVYFPRENLAVEINGSTHYYGLTGHLLPRYKLKKEVLRLAGVECLHLDYTECMNESNEVNAEKVKAMVSQALEVARGKKGPSAVDRFSELLQTKE